MYSKEEKSYKKESEAKTIDFKKNNDGTFVVDEEKEKEKSTTNTLKEIAIVAVGAAVGLGALVFFNHLKRKK